MKLPDDGFIEEKTEQDGKQREEGFQPACIRITMWTLMLCNTLRYGIFADFIGYEGFSILEIESILYCCILPYSTDHGEHKNCAHESLCE